MNSPVKAMPVCRVELDWKLLILLLGENVNKLYYQVGYHI